MKKSNIQNVIDFAIINITDGTVYVQKRAPDRKLFPNKWEIPGGHQEDNETIEECIKRELKEETNLDLIKIHKKIHSFIWKENPSVVNSLYVIEAQGDFKAEQGKVTDYSWIKEEEAGILLRKEEKTNEVHQGILKVFNYIKTLQR